MEEGVGDLAVSSGFRDVSAVEADPPPHDLVVRLLERLHQLPGRFQSLPLALCHFRIGSYSSKILIGLSSRAFAAPFQVRLAPVVPSRELVVLQRDAMALAFDLAHAPHGSPGS